MLVLQNTILQMALSCTVLTLSLRQCDGGQITFEEALKDFLMATTHGDRISAGHRVKDSASILFGTTGQEWFMTNSHTRSGFRDCIKKYEGRLRERVTSVDGDERLIALRLLGALGVEGRCCIPVIRRLASDDKLPRDTRMAAFFALCQVTPPNESVVSASLPVFVSLLNDSTREPNILGGNDTELRRYLRSSDVVLEFANAFVLTDRARTEAPALAQLLSPDYDSRIRLPALAVLGMLEEDAEAALPAIREQLASSSALTRNMAAHAVVMITRRPTSLRAIGRRAGLNGSKLDAFVSYHSGRLAQEKMEAKRSAAAVRENPIELVPMYKYMIRYAPERFKREAIDILRQAGAPAHTAVPLLKTVAKNKSLSPLTRAMASSAFSQIERNKLGKSQQEDRPQREGRRSE